ncbi:hypothetical protein ABZP36_030520 [Zizania latifolia]
MGTAVGGVRGGGVGGGAAGAGERWRWIVFLVLVFVSLLLPLLLLLLSASSSPPRFRLPGRTTTATLSDAVPVRCGQGAPPCLAYLLTGARGDGPRLLRLLLAVYHPRNQYALHLSADASDNERQDLAADVAAAAPAISAFRNVAVVGTPTAGTPVGSSAFAGHYVLTFSHVADLIHVLSNVSRQLNFVDHTSDIGQKESEKVQSMIVDAGIYLAGRTNFFRATEKRPTPDAFKFFTGSPWVILNRQFIEYCVLGWDNLPRILLMYFNNVMLPQEGYFHSVICNSLSFLNLTVNNDMRYTVWEDPPQKDPIFLDMAHYDRVVDSGAPFARRFRENEPLLDRIDGSVLGRWGRGPVPGAWCSGMKSWFSDPCSQWSDVNTVRPGPQAIKLHQLSLSAASQEIFISGSMTMEAESTEQPVTEAYRQCSSHLSSFSFMS